MGVLGHFQINFTECITIVFTNVQNILDEATMIHEGEGNPYETQHHCSWREKNVKH